MADGGLPLHNVPAWLTPVLTFVAMVATAILVYLGQRGLAKPAMQAALNDSLYKFATKFEERSASLEAELNATRREREELRHTLERERVETAQERAALRGDIAGLRQTVASLQEQLDRHGIPTKPRAPASSTLDPPPPMVVLADADPFALPSE